MSLSGNTEKINELLSKINALPEAGGGSGGLQVAEGTFSPTSIDIVNNPVTVSGLAFEPKYVFIFDAIASSTYYLYSSYNDNYIMSDYIKTPTAFYGKYRRLMSGTTSYSRTVFGTQSTNTTVYNLTINSDGFTLSGSMDTWSVWKTTYRYVAFG